MKKIILLSFALVQFFALHSQTISTIAGNGTAGYSGNGGPAVNALLDHPNQLAFDQNGNLFIAEDYNNLIRKIDTSGTISTVAGNGTSGFSGDGFAAINAQLNRATGVAVDAVGNIYICDADNFRIRKVDTLGIIHTIAGTGTSGYSGDGSAATAAEIGFCSGICLDATGNIYIATQFPGYCIRKINTAGIISTYAGNGTSGYNGDGILAVNAQLDGPASVFMDAANNLYIGDLSGFRIRKVDAAGMISTVAGNGNSASGGDGGPATSAQLFYPYGVASDAAGNIFICESGNNKIRRVDPNGQISTLAGIGGIIGGYGGNGGPAVLAQFYHPSAVALDATGNIFIGDYENSAIRKITPLTAISKVELMNKGLVSIYPNPLKDKLTIHFAIAQIDAHITIYSLLGESIKDIEFNGSDCQLSKMELAKGLYFVSILTENKVLLNQKIVVE